MNHLQKFENEFQKDTEILQNHHPELLSIWHNNKKGFKKENIDISPILTPERILEIKKCMADPFYFIENYLFIQTREKDEYGNRFRLFKLRKYQREQIELYIKNRFVVLLYPRRAGKTSGTVAFFLWKLLFENNFIVMCLANKDKNAMGIIAESKKFLKRLPLWMTEGISKLNDHEINFENGSQLFANATTADSGRSVGCSIVYIDESAFIEPNVWNDFYSAVSPVVEDSPDSKLFMTSTPNGMNHFYEICEDASLVDEEGKTIEQGGSSFVKKKIRWYEVPGRDESFKKRIIATYGLDHFNSEYDCEFLGSAGTLLSTETLKKMKPQPVIGEYQVLSYSFKIYQKPIEEHRYLVTHDPALGHGGDKDDYTAIIVWDITNPKKIKQVAVLYDKKVDIIEASFVLAEIGRMYNSAVEISERNKEESIPKRLAVELNYENVFIDKKGLYGLYQTQTSRSVSISTMKRLLERDEIEIVDFDHIKEFRSFVKKGDRYEADKEKHDDLIMSTSLLCFLLSDREYFERYFSDDIEFLQYRELDEFLDIIIDSPSGTTKISGNSSQEIISERYWF